jgi:hypothetical protein
MAKDRINMQLIGKLLGHTQPATTARYAHLGADPMRAASDLVGLLARSLGTALVDDSVLQRPIRSGKEACPVVLEPLPAV